MTQLLIICYEVTALFKDVYDFIAETEREEEMSNSKLILIAKNAWKYSMLVN